MPNVSRPAAGGDVCIELHESGLVRVLDELPSSIRATDVAILSGLFSGYEVYSETGEMFGVRSLDPEPTKTRARSLLSLVYNPLRWCRIEYFSNGNYDLEALKQKIRRFVANDQDVLTQFLDADEINLHLDRAGSFDKVVEAVRGIEGAWEVA